MPERVSLQDHFDAQRRVPAAAMATGIQGSRWFKTAPAEARRTAQITPLCVDVRSMTGIMGGTAERPCLVAECDCGGERQRFSLWLDDAGGAVAMISDPDL